MAERNGQDIARPARRRPPSITIADVARHVGCSPMTVSRVINGDANVKESTRLKVQAGISALNYTPNSAARSLAGAGQVRIGLLYSNPSAFYLSEFLVGSLDQASRSDAQMVVEHCEFGESAREAARHMIDSRVDAVILPSPLCDSPALTEMFVEAGIPAVAVGPGSPPPRISSVMIDDRAAAREMTHHIIAQGHQRIGFIVGNPQQSASACRLNGFLEAMLDAGIDVRDGYVVQGQFTYRSGFDAATRLLDLPEPPTAIFASNDDMAAAAVAVAHRRRLDVPADLTVCGYDDTAIASTIWPELTTIRQPIADMCRAAVEILVREDRARRAGRPLEPVTAVLDYQLIRRHSDAAPTLAPRKLRP